MLDGYRMSAEDERDEMKGEESKKESRKKEGSNESLYEPENRL